MCTTKCATGQLPSPFELQQLKQTEKFSDGQVIIKFFGRDVVKFEKIGNSQVAVSLNSRSDLFLTI